MKRSLQDPGVQRDNGHSYMPLEEGQTIAQTASGSSASAVSDRSWHLELYMVVAFGIIQHIHKSPYIQKWCGVYQMHINQAFT